MIITSKFVIGKKKRKGGNIKKKKKRTFVSGCAIKRWFLNGVMDPSSRAANPPWITMYQEKNTHILKTNAHPNQKCQK